MAYGFAGLPGDGFLVYNGVSFDAASSITVSQEPVLDDAGLGVKYNEITIRVRATITGGPTHAAMDTADIPMEVLRRRLLKSCGHLFFAQQGFGFPLEVNAGAGALEDVNFGPKTQILSWTPVGGNHTVEIEWAVKVALPWCYVARTQTSGIMALNFGMSFSIDHEGLTTRSIHGYYEIAMTLPSKVGAFARLDRKLPDTADAYWDGVFKRFKAPRGFRRTFSRDLSLNKKRVDFKITDTEIPSNNPYPTAATQISASHTTSWSRAKLLTYRNSISARISTRVRVSPLAAWSFFAQLVRQRMEHAKFNARNNWVILDELTATEEIYGLSHSFRAGYRFLSGIEDFMHASGMFKPVGGDWDKWALKLDETTRSSRGNAELQHSHTYEEIYDLCGGKLPDVTDPGFRTKAWNVPPGRDVLQNTCPPQDRSWQRYNVVVMPERQRAVSRQQILQQPAQALPQVIDSPFRYEYGTGSETPRPHESPRAARNALNVGGGGNQQPLNPPNPFAPGNPQAVGTSDVIHESGIPAYSFHYAGYAERVGWEIPRQTLVQIGMQPTTEVSNRFLCRCIGNYLGVPVYQASWHIVYVLPNAPAQVDAWQTGQVMNLASDMK